MMYSKFDVLLKYLFPLDTAGYVKIWHYPTQQCVFTFDEKERQPLALDFNCNYTRLYVGGKISHNKKVPLVSICLF